jgi:hypothetical protein
VLLPVALLHLPLHLNEPCSINQPRMQSERDHTKTNSIKIQKHDPASAGLPFSTTAMVSIYLLSKFSILLYRQKQRSVYSEFRRVVLVCLGVLLGCWFRRPRRRGGIGRSRASGGCWRGPSVAYISRTAESSSPTPAGEAPRRKNLAQKPLGIGTNAAVRWRIQWRVPKRALWISGERVRRGFYSRGKREMAERHGG